ncbi:MAG: FAD-dependent oxidoreductase [Planctomycetota bacterium]
MSSTRRYCIVGGVAGGASAAARLRRRDEEAEIILFERGPYVSFANCGLPYHIGGQIQERDALLVASPELLRQRAGLDVRTDTEVVAIDRNRRQLTARGPHGEETITYDALILSPGAAPVRPPIPGIDSARIHTLRNIPDMDAIKQRIDNDQARRALVVGGGYIGLEMVEALRDRDLATTLVELMPQVMGPADPEMATPLHQQLQLHGVDLVLGRSVERFEETDSGISASLSDGERIEADIVILAIGVKPESRLAQEAGLDLGSRGGIAVDEHLQTSDPHIWAVGDAIEVVDLTSRQASLIPLAGPANRQGRIAADNIVASRTAGDKRRYQASQGTAICKVFDLAIGMTGLSEKSARRNEIPYEKVYVHPLDHAEYYPGASRMTLKLLFDPADGRVLGGQAVGAGGVDKRIDVIAMAVRHRLTVHDLAEAELSYAPPYGAAKDPVNYAGFVAENLLAGSYRPIQAEEARDWDGPAVSVCSPPEHEAGSLPGAVNIPIDELRQRLDELPRGKELLVYCPAGLRGYLACRILEQEGIRCRNLVGGLKVFNMQNADPTGYRRTPAGGGGPSDSGLEPAAAGPSPGAATSAQATTAVRIDACGMQCPGPIMKLARSMQDLEPGQVLEITATDPGFTADVPAWCSSTGNELLACEAVDGAYRARMRKAPVAQPVATTTSTPPTPAGMTIVLFSGDWDKAMAAFIIANGAASMGMPVTIFCTFWGLTALRSEQPPPVAKNLVERMFGWMLPRGARKLALSRMHMAGMGRLMMDGIMKQKGVDDLPSLIASARSAGVTLVSCAMSMDLMGIRKEELIDGVEMGGVASYLGQADQGRINLFI